MGINNKFYILNGTNELRKFEESIESCLKIKKSPDIMNMITFYDTFDWLFYSKGYHLFNMDNRLCLSNFNSNSIVSDTIQISSGDWFFPRELGGTFSEKLLKISNIRAIRKVIEAVRIESDWDILNNDDKTVATLKIFRYRDVKNLFCINFFITKGYEDLSFIFESLLKDKYTENEAEDELSVLLQDSEDKPMSYSPKMDFMLEPDESAVEASGKILKHLLKIMKQNENGIISDIDTEFLHDYRVAVRRSRSFLSIVKNVFSDSTTIELKNIYRSIGVRSNLLRDLDVLLHDRENYNKILPDQLNAGIDKLFRQIEADRIIRQKKLSDYILSNEYRDRINRAESIISGDDGSGLCSKESTSSISSRLIVKKYKSIRKAAQRVNETSTDEDIHLLRIEFKKLRYIIEFFSSLYTVKEFTSAFKKIKKIQDELGRYNDLSVHQCIFCDYLNFFVEKGDAQTAASVGGVISALNTEKNNTRASVIETISGITDGSVEMLIKKIQTAPQGKE